MQTVIKAISDLLFVRDTVVVPGLGAFVKKPTSAQVNRVANYFSAPSCEVEFDDDLREDNDLIVNYIADENKIPEDEARRLLAIFVADCFNKLKEGEKVTLEGIGTLRYDWHSDIVLEQDTKSNFNSDAFGLSDFTAVPVDHSATKEEIKAEIEQQQKYKNTPVTVDEKAVHEEEEQPRRRVWPWILLLLLLLAGLVFALQYYHVVDFKEWFTPKTPIETPIKPVETDKPVEPAPVVVVDTLVPTETDTVELPAADTLAETAVSDSVVNQPVEELTPIQVVEPEPKPAPVEEVKPVEEEGKILIVAGCFSIQSYADNMVNKLKEQGYETALSEKHGDKWYVAFGRYRTDEEALAALREIKADGNTKAWIRK